MWLHHETWTKNTNKVPPRASSGKDLTGAKSISLRGPLCAGEAYIAQAAGPGGRPPRPCLYVKPAGAPREAECKVLLALRAAKKKLRVYSK